MAEKPKNPFQFWEELKQRRVVRVITVYIASSFAILQGVDMVFSRLGFPSWTVTLVMIILTVGLVVSIILSWIYDITPKGIRKTKDVEQEIIENIEGVEIGTPVRKQIIIPDTDELLKEKKLFAEKINKYKKKEKIYSLSSMVVIIAVVVLFLFSSGKTIPFSKRDWILISDFENLTENSVFDKSLYTAFSLTINQSRHINVFPRSRMIETMTMMKAKDAGNIDERTGREIALREGIHILIAPSISEVGNRFVITAKILDTKTGNLFKSIILNADTPEQILTKLDQLSKKIRRDLGESRYRIALQDKPLATVTTSSLEALKQYSLGIEHHWLSDFAGAKGYYENALLIDSGFTAAKASLGSLLIQKFDPIKGRELLNQAVKSIDNLSDREKYSILAFHAADVEKDYSKAIENMKILIRLYPDDYTHYNNLGWYYQQSKQYEDALIEYKKAININPNLATTYNGILWIYDEFLGKPDSLFIWAKKMIADNPRNAWGYFHLGSAFVCIDSINSSITAFQKAREIDPYFVNNLFRLAYSYRLQGLYSEAIRILERITEINKYEISVYYNLGVVYQLMGNLEEARKNLTEYKQRVTNIWLVKFPDIPETYTVLSKALERLGDQAASQQMLQKAISIDSTVHISYAEVFCTQGKIPEAIDQVEKALGKGYRNLYWLKANPDLRPLQNEIRFRELLVKYFK